MKAIFLITRTRFAWSIAFFITIFPPLMLFAQRDLIVKKDSGEIRCKVLKATATKYWYAYINPANHVLKSTIIKSEVDTVVYNKFAADLINHKLFGSTAVTSLTEADNPPKAWQFTFALGLNVGNVLEFNSPSGPDKKSFSATTSVDLGLNYVKDQSRFSVTNEVHWTLAIQKAGFTNTSHLQRATDDLSTLHDFSISFTKKKKWNFNIIAKTNTSVFTIFDGDFFKDYNNLGRTQAFLNPYEVIISPGIKFQPDKYFRISISPYSFSLYGLTNQQIANTGNYTQTFDTNNNYDLFVYKQLGAEVNLWYDRKFKKWLDIQYRLGLSSDYFTKLANNGLMNGLFISKFRVFKNVSLSHRAILKGDFSSSPFKPYYNQTILLGYSKSF